MSQSPLSLFLDCFPGSIIFYAPTPQPRRGMLPVMLSFLAWKRSLPKGWLNQDYGLTPKFSPYMG